jgi:transposase, IS30 family
LAKRPERISERVEFGHRECDLMMFRKEHGKVNVTSLVERVSRYVVVMRNEDRQSKPIMVALIQGLAPLPADARQSITFERGTEFSA